MRIAWTPDALADLQGIKEYIGRDSRHYANSFVRRLIESVDVLRRFPEMGQVVPELAEKGLREKLFEHYRIIYHVRMNTIRVLAVIHASRDSGALSDVDDD